jgi:hypothetical protein
VLSTAVEPDPGAPGPSHLSADGPALPDLRIPPQSLSSMGNTIRAHLRPVTILSLAVVLMLRHLQVKN